MIPFVAIGPGPDYPAEASVEDGVEYDFGNLTGTFDTGGDCPTASAIANAVRTELAVELARIDTTISSRSSQTSVDQRPRLLLRGATVHSGSTTTSLNILTGDQQVSSTNDAYNNAIVIVRAASGVAIGTAVVEDYVVTTLFGNPIQWTLTLRTPLPFTPSDGDFVDIEAATNVSALADIHKAGETRRYTQIASNDGNKTADVSIGDPL